MPTKVEFRSQQYSRGHPRKRVAGCPDKRSYPYLYQNISAALSSIPDMDQMPARLTRCNLREIERQVFGAPGTFGG